MKAEASANADKAKVEKERVEKLNQADSLIFQTEKQLKEYGDKIPADKKGAIETALNKLREAHKSQDISQIDPAVTELNNAWTAASEELYKATQGAGGPEANANGGQQQQQGNNGAGNAGENVTDAEFEELK